MLYHAVITRFILKSENHIVSKYGADATWSTSYQVRAVPVPEFRKANSMAVYGQPSSHTSPKPGQTKQNTMEENTVDKHQ